LKVLDLFSGLEGWSEPFRERGHEVITLDINPDFHPMICKDIIDFEIEDLPKFWKPEIILASPPCNCFSISSSHFHWRKTLVGDFIPLKSAIEAIALIKKTLSIIEQLNPLWWILENPRGRLRSLNFMKKFNRLYVTQCQYGERRMKPTDLWGVFPQGFIPKSCKYNSTCHDRAPRGTHGIGTQSVGTSAERAKIPYLLALDICLNAEKERILENRDAD